jgi:adenosylmethionine-8-amino-7-oxononanoate aminotransferase
MNLSEKEKENLKKSALRYVIPHFASNAELAKGPKIFTRGEGCYVYDLDGKKYFDSFATLLTTVCGHKRPEVTEAVKKQMDALEFFPNYVDTFTVPLIQLAEKLAGIMPGDLSVSFFVNSGSEANETALKIARQYHLENGEPHRYKFLARRDSYHATTLGGTSVTGLTWFREYFEPLMPGSVFVSAARKRDCPSGMSEKDYSAKLLAELEETIIFESPETIAGMIMDPLPGSNTAYPLPPEGYLQGVRDICDKYGIILIFDEIQTGFGKTGKWFFCEHENVVPDIMTIGKGFTGGFIPLGATVTTQKIANAFKEPGHELRSGSTYGGHTTACAATIANLEIIENEKLVENAEKTGKYLADRLKELQKKYKFIKEVSGMGLLWAVIFDVDKKLNLGTKIRDWCWQNGIILRNNGDILVFAPSLIISREEVDMLIEKVDKAIGSVLR